MATGKKQLEDQNSQSEIVMVNAANEPTEWLFLELWGKQRYLRGFSDHRVDQVVLEGVATCEDDRCVLPDQDIGRIYIPNDASGFDHGIECPSEVDRDSDEEPSIGIGEACNLALWAGERGDRKPPSH
jgi:hypothetical protein